MRRRLLCAFLVLGAVGGCGNSRTVARGLFAPMAPVGARHFRLPGAGLAFQTPRNWTTSFAVQAPLVFTVSSGAAVAALWLYPHPAGLPQRPVELGRAASQLVAQARRRDPRLRVLGTSVTEVDGHPAVELDALEHNQGRLRRVRSVHVFAGTREVVLDAYAPPASFRLADRWVFSPLARSLRLTPPTA